MADPLAATGVYPSPPPSHDQGFEIKIQISHGRWRFVRSVSSLATCTFCILGRMDSRIGPRLVLKRTARQVAGRWSAHRHRFVLARLVFRWDASKLEFDWKRPFLADMPGRKGVESEASPC